MKDVTIHIESWDSSLAVIGFHDKLGGLRVRFNVEFLVSQTLGIQKLFRLTTIRAPGGRVEANRHKTPLKFWPFRH